MTQQLKLNLTSQALERLIGDDTEMCVTLRQGIAAEFAKRHLKGIFSAAVNLQIEAFQKEIFEVAKVAVLEQFNSGQRPFVQPSLNFLNHHIAAELKKLVQSTTNGIVADVVREELGKIDLPAMINEYVTRHVGAKTNDAIHAQVRDKVQAVLNAVFKTT